MCVRERACARVSANGLAHAGLRGENCILMQNYYCIYKPTQQQVPTCPATFVPTNPADASHFVTPSIFFTSQIIVSKSHQITPYILHHPGTNPYCNAPYQPKSKHEDRNVLLLSTSYFWRYFTRKTCVNNACSTIGDRGHLLSKHMINFAIWQFVWH